MTDWYQTWKQKTERVKRRGSWRPSLSWRNQLSKAKLWRNIALIGCGFVVFGLFAFVGLFAWYAKDLPQPDKVVRRDGFSTKIKDRNGELLYEIFTDKQRTPAVLEDIPDSLKKAVVAIEDQNFYKHTGYDGQSYLRIVWNVITKRRLIGGSTLTQQLVKNVLLTNERSLTRKLKELILAVQIEKRYNKDQILLMYLNENPYGGTIWGVATAAQVYFHKPVKELTMLESAILAGMPQRPTYFSPLSSQDTTAYKGRTKDVLRRMREENYITRDQEQQLLAELQALEIKPTQTSMKAPHFTMYVKDLLEEMYGQAMVEQGGLQVTTTLDYELQQKAQQIVTEEVAKVASQDIGNGAALVMNPTNGEIWAMVGSKDFFAKDYDGQVNVTLAKRQPGSSIKPLTYAIAFAKGYTPATMLMDVPTEFPGATADKPYAPQNYDGTFRGPVQLRFALGSSLNIPAVKLLALIGVEDMLQAANDVGLTTLAPTKENINRFGLSLTLGGGEVRLLDLTSAYSSFANSGLKVEPVGILKVEDKEGKVLYEHKQTTGKRVWDEGVTFLINHVLMDNNARLLSFGANSYLNMGGRPVSVKTGTTNDRKDNWTIGWANTGIVGVWVGNNDNKPMKSVTSGVTGAAPIWRRIMLEVLQKYPASEWKIPDTVEAKMVDIVSGYPEHDGFASRAEYVIKGTLPPLPDPIHHRVKMCKGQEKLASQIDVERGNYDEIEAITPIEDKKLGTLASWKEQNLKWAMSQGDPKYRIPTEYCSSDDIAVSFDGIGDHSNFDSTDIQVKIRAVSSGEIQKVEVFVDGSRREELVDRPYETTLSLSKGKYTLKAKAYRNDGKTAETGEIHIGTGGMKWDEGANPSPSPSPSPGTTVGLLMRLNTSI